MTLKQPSQSFLPSGHPTCQSCSVAGPLQRKGWLHCRLQHKEESSSLKYLGSEFNLKGVEARSFHSRCAAVWGVAQRPSPCPSHFCSIFPIPYVFLPLGRLSFSTLVLHHSISCYVFSRMMQGRARCQRWAAGVVLWKCYRKCCLGWTQVWAPHGRQGLAGLAGPGRVEHGGLGSRVGGPWQTLPLGEQLLPHCHPSSGTGAGVTLPVGPDTLSVSKRHMCVSVWCVHVFKCVCVRLCVSAVATYSCQTSVDRHEHPSGSLPGAWDILLLLSAWKESESHG